mgnify:FL=1
MFTVNPPVLAVNFVKISTKLQYVAQVSETEEKIISLQEMLDAMLPNMLAVLYTGLMFYLIKKKKWSYIQTGYLYDYRGNPSFCDRYTWIK